ncbi:proteasome subunit beta type 1, putative, partial [Ichthyophthirius multifiliis]
MNFPIHSFPNDMVSHLTKEHKIAPQENIEAKKPQFNPYVFNAGTVCAIGGKGFVIVAGDTRLSQGYSIISRENSKLCKLSDNVYLATSGMYADFVALSKQLQSRLQMYQYNNQKQASMKAISTLLSRTLYYKRYIYFIINFINKYIYRFFPYYTFNLLAGFDNQGNGQVIGYDAVGSGDFKQYAVLGSGAQLIVPIFDQIFEG